MKTRGRLSGVTISVTIIGRTCLITADGLAVISTWRALSSRHGGTLKGSISRVLLFDGTAYFGCLCVLNCLHLTFTLLSLDIFFLQGVSNVTDFTVPLSAILVSRFLLHLQSANLRAIGTNSSRAFPTSHNSSVIFERVVGSLGASMVPDDYFSQVEDWEGGTSDHIDGEEEVNQTQEE